MQAAGACRLGFWLQVIKPIETCMVLLMANACTLCACNQRSRALEGSNKSDLHLWTAVEEEPVMYTSEKVLVPKRRSKSAFLSFMFPNHGARMTFAAQGHKAHMVLLHWICLILRWW